jgi:hypothetical protein
MPITLAPGASKKEHPQKAKAAAVNNLDPITEPHDQRRVDYK